MLNKYLKFSFSLFLVSLIAIRPAGAVKIDDVMPQLVPSLGTPMTMINLSRDHQLSYKAYNEYTDLDGDGVPERTYLHKYQYYGYFDSKKCYSYDTSSRQFNPIGLADKVTNFCNSAWSGNFLNWATMTRMDVVRKILYGGYRAIDTTNQTVLERAYLPTDAHAFAKFYDGTGGAAISQVTPITVGTSVTICNATISSSSSSGANRYSHTNTDRPLMRVASGDFSLWNSNERWQCYWSEEKSASNGNNPATTGLPAAGSNPSRSANGSGTGLGDFVVRVRVCDATAGGLTDDEAARCRQYNQGTRKPIGLLHTYGENDQSEFGLITGSYGRNISGGVLRRNVTSFGSEVNYKTDGTFTSAQGIVYNINRIRQYGYDYNDGTYIGADNCTYQRIGIGTGGPYAVPEGSCSSWGNPIGTMFLEALRYFSGASSATAAFLPGGGSKDSALGLTVEPFRDPFKQNNQATFGEAVCRPINVINFNASVNSYDSDNTKWAGFSALNGAPNINSLTDQIGSFEGFYNSGSRWFVGNNGSGTNNNLCTAKSISSLSSVTGICPEAPTYYGSYKLAGAALYAHTTPIRNDFTIPAGNTKAFRVNTYSVALATSAPRIEVNVNGRKVVIQPSYRLDLGGANVGAGTLVDFRIVTQTPTYGRYVVQWEDSEQGGDYDQDIWGTMEYQVSGNRITVSTRLIGFASASGQGMGYVISGTDQDGPHYHSGAYGFSYTDLNPPLAHTGTRVNATGGCAACNGSEGLTTATYSVSGNGVVGNALNDPLFYAAKYGNFTGNYTGAALTPSQWDTKLTNGLIGSDGIPDSYFYAIDPAQLERSIQAIFNSLINNGGTSPAVTGSRLAAGGKLFVTEYTNNTNDIAHGNISSFVLDSGGNPGSTAEWTAAFQLTQRSPSSRNIITNNSGVGQPFQWNNTSLSAAQMLALNTSASNFNDGYGNFRLDFLRGDRSKENIAPYLFRRREASVGVLGDIINSTPWYVAVPSGAYPEVLFPGFRAFLNAQLNRTPIVYVGANDGMLHAFNANTGAEVLAFVPNSVYRNLSKLTDSSYIPRTFVDGAIFAGDADVNGWKTYLIGTTGRGAQSIFALDVTNPGGFSESNASAIFKWEFSDQDDPDLGNIVGNPTTNSQTNAVQQIVRMNNNKWAVVMGNGYNSDRSSDSKGVTDNYVSSSGGAVLYVLFLDGPSGPGNTWLPTLSNGATKDYVKIPLYDPTCGSAIPLTDDRCRGFGPDNGLGMVTPFDLDNDGKADFLYAADLKGNVWKVDVRGAPGTWINNYSRLYSAAVNVTSPAPAHLVPQPITTAVTAIGHPFGGVMVNFITGKSLASPDLNDTLQQTLYGIWDRPRPLPAGVVYPPSSDRSRLQAQQVGTVVSGNGRGGFSAEIDFSTKDGWYYDLPAVNEKGIFNPFFNDNDILVFDTIYSVSTSLICSAETGTYLNLLDPITGKAPEVNLDINGDFKINSQDRVNVVDSSGKTISVSASGVAISKGVSGSTRIANISNPKPTKAINGTDCLDSYKSETQNGIGTTVANCATNTGRIYWREITRDGQ